MPVKALSKQGAQGMQQVRGSDISVVILIRGLQSLAGLLSVCLLLLSIARAEVPVYVLGTKDMDVGAGAKPVKISHQRRNIVKLSGPAELNKPDTEYVVESNIVADGTAFTITADNVTLNLNGHTVVYNNKKLSDDPKSVYGIIIPRFGQSNIAIVNGKIKQGAGQGGGNVAGWGHNPIFAEGVKNLEIAGINAEYSGKDIVGFFIHWGENAHIHHNTIEDRGTHITNRHQGLDAIRIEGANAKIHHNLVKRARHRAFIIAGNSEVFNNEIYIDSHATNSFGVTCYKINNFKIHHNKIYGTGEHPIGIGAVAGSSNGEIYSNYIEVQNTRKSAEYGSTGSAGIRLLWGSDNIDVHHNTLIVHAQNDYLPEFNSWGRAVWVGLPKPEMKAFFHDNVIIANNKDGRAKAAAIGITDDNEVDPGNDKKNNLIFQRNRIISNWANVLLGDNYGHGGGYTKFIENTFVRQDNYPAYKTIRSQYQYRPSTAIFINNQFDNGASLDSIELEFNGKGRKEIAVGWHLNIVVKTGSGTSVSNADIAIYDKEQSRVYTGATDPEGNLRADIIQYLHTNRHNSKTIAKGAIIMRTPHRIVVTKDGMTVEKQITIDGNKTVEFTLQGWRSGQKSYP